MEQNNGAYMELLEKLQKLPLEVQRAMFWAIENYDGLQKISKNSAMTLTEIEKEIQIAIKDRQYGFLMLLFMCKENIARGESTIE